MQTAFGLIETQGLVSAIAALDAALKSAPIRFAAKEKATGGLVTIIITGDVSAVEAAVKVGSEAAEKVGRLVASHVIPRLTREVIAMVGEEPVEELSPRCMPLEAELPGDDLGYYRVPELRQLARTLGVSTLNHNKIRYATVSYTHLTLPTNREV